MNLSKRTNELLDSKYGWGGGTLRTATRIFAQTGKDTAAIELIEKCPDFLGNPFAKLSDDLTGAYIALYVDCFGRDAMVIHYFEGSYYLVISADSNIEGFLGMARAYCAGFMEGYPSATIWRTAGLTGGVMEEEYQRSRQFGPMIPASSPFIHDAVIAALETGIASTEVKVRLGAHFMIRLVSDQYNDCWLIVSDEQELLGDARTCYYCGGSRDDDNHRDELPTWARLIYARVCQVLHDYPELAQESEICVDQYLVLTPEHYGSRLLAKLEERIELVKSEG